MGVEVYRYDLYKALLVEVNEDTYGTYKITARFATMQTDIDLWEETESSHREALRRARRTMDQIGAIMELLDDYTVNEENL